jgi:hypothetical protein
MSSRSLPAGFVSPCLPSSGKQPPIGPEWLVEIKHDGFRVIARKEGNRVRLYSRPGNDLTYRFPLIVEALLRLRPRSCMSMGKQSRAELTELPPSIVSDPAMTLRCFVRLRPDRPSTHTT